MNDQERAEARHLLCLAALFYRGFEDVLQHGIHLDRLQGALDAGLGKLAGVCGSWKRVWGPSAYRAPLSLFDDELMYVVQTAGDPNRYVVVIRGTNPVSAFDWLFGDLWVGAQVPWPYGDRTRFPDAKISLSTLLGLNVLQILHSSAAPEGRIAGILRGMTEAAGDLLKDVGAVLRPLQGALAAQIRGVRDEVLPLLAQLDAVRQARRKSDPTTRVLGLLDDWRSATRQHAFKRILDAANVVAAAGSFNMLRFLEGGARLEAGLEPGATLLAFLTAAVQAADGKNVEIVVTGHSKGGALASTVALWLADTQGTDHVDSALQWDPRRKATVRCFSFAGPTAGNGAFVARSDAVIGDRCWRVANTLDIVPHAWTVDDLKAIPTLYTNARPVPVLRDLLVEIASQVGPLGYTHVGRHVVELPGVEDDRLREFFPQFVYQHLTGYLRALELGELVNVLTFFGPGG